MTSASAVFYVRSPDGALGGQLNAAFYRHSSCARVLSIFLSMERRCGPRGRVALRGVEISSAPVAKPRWSGAGGLQQLMATFTALIMRERGRKGVFSKTKS